MRQGFDNVCIINSKDGNYPNPHLSGVGVVYKFCEYIDTLLFDDAEHVSKIRDLAATGLIADMVNLQTYENRYLVRTGLEDINNPFLKGMIEKNSFMIKEEEITPTDIAFSIAPYVNAVCRIGTMDEKRLLFDSLLSYKANNLVPSNKRGSKEGDMETIVSQSLRMVANVKSRQNKERDKILTSVKRKIQTEHIGELDQFLMVILEQEEGNQNLNGLVANELVSTFNKPSMVLIDYGENSSGSVRGVNDCGLEDLRELLESTNLTEYAQGQPNAFGLSVLNNDIESFKDSLNELLKDYTFEKFYKVDYIFPAKAIQKDILLEIAGLKSYWGQGVPESLVAIEGLKVRSETLKLMSPDKRPTLKFIGDGLDFIKFKSSEEEYNKLLNLIGEGYVVVDLVGSCNRNEWNGEVKPQIIIKEYEIKEVVPYDF